MSIVRILARHTICEALRDRTEVGNNVFNSLINGVKLDGQGNLNIGEGQKKPFISVFTDMSETKAVSMNNMREPGLTDIVIEWGYAEGMAAVNEDGETFIMQGLAVTDDAIEFTLDIIAHQIIAALNADTVWAERWKQVRSGGIKAMRRFRYADQTDNTRLAVQQLRLDCRLMDDPMPGEPLPYPIEAILSDMDLSQDLNIQAHATLIRNALTGTITDWQAVQRRFGMSRDQLLALGRGPLAGDDERATPPLQSGVLARDNGPDETIEPDPQD